MESGNSPGDFYIRVGAPAPGNPGAKVDFIAAGDGVPVSPVFVSLRGLYEWMDENGWESYEYDEGPGPERFYPWRVKPLAGSGAPS